MNHKSGFVNIVGRPNVGKSTLINAFVGERLSIITAKAQTTRHRILGIVNQAEYQIVFSDTPGIVTPGYKLHESMLRTVISSFDDADIVLFLTDIDEYDARNNELVKLVNNLSIPVLVLVNKIDLSNTERITQLLEYWSKKIPNGAVLPISALNNFNVDTVFKKIVELLPESPPYYEKDAFTDRPFRFFMSEIIREKIMLNYQQEIPYSCEVVITSFKEDGNLTRIDADIIVARKSQKGILIGHLGNMLKKTGTMARKDMEKFLRKKVFLQLYVKVDENWREDDNKLKKYGYL